MFDWFFCVEGVAFCFDVLLLFCYITVLYRCNWETFLNGGR